MSVQLVVASGSRVGQVIPIIGDRFVIGRADDCNLKPRSELISRYHCEIYLSDGGVYVRDMGSKNGVFVNERQITGTQEVKSGDRLAVGPLEFLIHVANAPKPVSQKAEKVKSVSDAVARTAALQSENAQKDQEDAITDWLLAAGESGDDLETRTIDASELINHLHAQSVETTERSQEEDTGSHSVNDAMPGSPTSSRDAASELLRKFFKGGK